MITTHERVAALLHEAWSAEGRSRNIARFQERAYATLFFNHFIGIDEPIESVLWRLANGDRIARNLNRTRDVAVIGKLIVESLTGEATS